MKKYFIFLFILFIIPNVFALDYANGVYVNNNTTISVTDVNNNSYTVPLQSSVTVNDVTDVFIGLGLNVSYNLVKDRYYELEISLTSSHFNSLANNVNIYSQNNVCILDEFVDNLSNYPKFRFHCNDNVSGISIVVNNANNQSALITTDNSFYFNYAFLRYAKSVQEEVSDSLSETNQKLDDLNDNITNSTQEIIDNQNQNTQQQIQSQQVCDIIDANDIVIDNKTLQANGSLGNSNNNGITDYIKVDKNTRLTRIINTGFKAYFCFYDVNKTLISCVSNQDIATNEAISIPNSSIYVRFSFNKVINEPQYQICTNGNQALDDTLTDSSIDNGLGQDFFDNFTDNDFGLSQIITIPLNTIQQLTSTSCVTINVPIPFTNETVPLPCLTAIYQKFPTLFNLWQVVSFGLIAYFIAIDIFHIVKGFKDPESDKVEVLDL